MADGDLRRIFQDHLPGLHWQSIETGMTGRGIPDSNYCGQGVEGWIEYKYTEGWRVPLRPEQVGWMLRRSRAGGRCFIAISRKREELWLYPGRQAAELKMGGLKAVQPLLHNIGGPANWNWQGISSILLHREMISPRPGNSTQR